MELKGMTWSHDRGIKPLLAASEKFNELYPNVTITWDARSLADFELFPLNQLAEEYDLIMIDHPHLGVAYAQNLLKPIDELLDAEFIKNQEENSVGLSHQSYYYEGHQFALAADAAAQFSAYRDDILKSLDILQPATWEEVFELAEKLPKEYKMGIPFVPVHAYSSFFSLCSQFTEKLFWSNGDDLATEIGLLALGLLRKLLSVSARESFEMDPINLLDEMSSDNRIVYCPLVYGYSTYSEKGYGEHRLKFNEIPSDTGTPNGSMIGGVGLAISSKCSEPKIAAEFVKMTVGKEFQETIFVDNFGQPGYRGAWNKEDVNNKSFDFYRDTLDTMDYGSMRPRFNGYIDFQAEAGSNIRQYFLDGRNDDTEFIAELNELFNKYYVKRNEIK